MGDGSKSSKRLRDAAPWLLTLAAVALAYSNALFGVFLFDDYGSIVENIRIRSLWPLRDVFQPLTRGLVQWSFAVNYRMGGLNPGGYRAVNIVIHAGAALLLFGIVRRTLRDHLEFCDEDGKQLGGLAAAAWAVHPLQTESVTYVVQRAETAAGLLVLLALYAVIRSYRAIRPRRWWLLATAAAWAGAMTKETAVVILPLVLLHDRAFVASSFGEALGRRKGLYVGLASAWLFLAALVVLTPDPSGVMGGGIRQYAAAGAAFWQAGVTSFQYTVTQLEVVARYLRLTVWPDVLCLDYAWPPAQRLSEVDAGALVTVAAMVGTAWLCWRCKMWSYPALWFWVALAPSSSVLPVADLAFEHRMYLPLAGPVVLSVVGSAAVVQRLKGGPCVRRLVLGVFWASLIAALAVRTWLRNQDYSSEERMWRVTVEVRPDNLRARNEWAIALSEQGRVEEAEAQYREVIRRAQRQLRESSFHSRQPPEVLRSNTSEANLFRAYANRGLLRVSKGDPAAGIQDYLAALSLQPDSVNVSNKLQRALRMLATAEDGVEGGR